MDIKELRSKYKAAKTALDASPEDADLKSALEAARTAYESALDADEDSDDSSSGKKGDDEGDDDSLDESKLDPKTQAHLKKLRRENAKHRTTAKSAAERLSALESGIKKLGGSEDDERSAEDKLGDLQANNEGLAFKTAVLEAAIEHGVGKDDREYFEFLVAKKLNGLKENEEMNEDDFADIAKASKKSGGGKIRTSVDDSDAQDPDKKGEMNVDQFVKMDTVAKSVLFNSNRALYDKLFAEAKEKRRLI